MNADRVRAAADRAAESATDMGDPVTVGKDEWFDLLDAIYDEGDYEQDEEDGGAE